MTRAWVFPGQGSQKQGMGAELFDRFPAEVATADRVIGVPLRELCADVRGEYLDKTRYVQPAVFAVSALAGRAALADGPPPDLAAGHSLGEYTALHLAGCLDFESALRLVVRRGELMGAVTGGAMLAVLGLSAERVAELIAGIPDVDVANHNLPDQLVLAGSGDAVRAVVAAVRNAGTGRCVPLAVSIAAHSRFMADAAAEFAEVLRDVHFAPPAFPVLSNVTAEPHRVDALADLLRRHFTEPVRWWDTLCRLARAGVVTPTEIGPGEVLTKMWRRAQPALPAPDPAHRPTGSPPPRTPATPRPTGFAANPAPTPPALAVHHAPVAPQPARADRSPVPEGRRSPDPEVSQRTRVPGSAALRAEYDLRHACLAGSLDRGVSSPALLRRLSAAGLLGFHGTRGLAPHEVRTALDDLRGVERFGMAWPAGGDVRAVADLYLASGVRHVEVVGTHTDVGPDLVRFRFSGGPRQVLVRVADPATAARFLRPADPAVLRALVAEGHLTTRDATAAAGRPIATDIAVEGDWPAVLPATAALGGARFGVAGVGTPAAASAAFTLGADFVLTTTVNQTTPEAATSAAAKDLLTALGVADTRDAPEPERFALGGRTPVARKGTLYAARAEQLYRLYLRHGRLEDIAPDRRAELGRTHFGRPLEAVWAGLGTRARDDRHRMALVFAAYCREATDAALAGTPDRRRDYRVPCGSDVGAFNAFTSGTPLADWRARHVDLIAEELMSPTPRPARSA
ncbi:ACP S-malonyltransferase [Saccharothrix obliqua]|uniref:ACP S-malonyltransferase n=1 Tax=Saccharothrix obliqua TaxID=2861747 RepID=UPI001C5CC91A|nr:ACP S-malonyltransferase [Saccharothrix obliqua]MBW4720353.1 ACP S-malonyltransferase [Saccharothrix obliqua]